MRAICCIMLFFVIPAFQPGRAEAQLASGRDSFTILISNDDGFAEPGIVALVRELSQIATIVVAAPTTVQSGTGHGITYREPIMVRVVEESDTLKWYSVDARPATIVRLAIDELMEEPPDLVVSGINTSANLGTGTWVSGTVAAAREAALDGIPAIAVSLQGGAREHPDDYDSAAIYVRNLIGDLRDHGMLSAGLLLNINFPRGISTGYRGSKIASASTRSGIQGYERRQRPRGNPYYWDTWVEKEDDEPGTDIHAVAQGYVSITPLVTNQTATSRFAEFEYLEQ